MNILTVVIVGWHSCFLMQMAGRKEEQMKSSLMSVAMGWNSQCGQSQPYWHDNPRSVTSQAWISRQSCSRALALWAALPDLWLYNTPSGLASLGKIG